jgi:hypothetical protein
MAKYTVNNSPLASQQALTTTYKTLAALYCSATTRRFKIYEFEIGTNAVPADNVLEWDISRQTAAGTATAFTPNKLDQADGTSVTTVGVNATAEGTITAASSVFYQGINQRTSYRWIAREGCELVAPAVNLSGFALRAQAAVYTGTGTATVYIDEM